MKLKTVLAAIMIGLFSVTPLATLWAANESPDLVISQFKVTSKNGQFFMLYNNSDEAIDMGKVQLVYYNSYNLADATSSKIIQLSGELEPGEYYLVNDGPYTLCYKMIVNSVNLSFSTTAGTLQVQTLEQAEQGGQITTRQHDFVSWSKTTKTGVIKLPSDLGKFLLRRPVDIGNNPSINMPGQGSWIEVASSADDPCAITYEHISEPPTIIETSMLLLSSTPPPVTIISTIAQSTGPYLPPADIGLMAPVVNELLANPASPLTDADDEYIELYNPNEKPFDLSGFAIQVGLGSSPRSYKFPFGTMLKPKSFTAFYSSETNLALSNSGSKAVLLDPFGSSISASQEYGSAKDNEAWALANNEWFDTTTPTPGEANVITGYSHSSDGSASSSSNKTRDYSGAPAGSGENVLGSNSQQKVADLHPSTLAGVAALAVGYGAYEYRLDLANRYRQFRANAKAGRKDS